ncbi:response regulator [Sulfuricurvum sp.]|uniref:response regulator n=1 Tax=Sulfuricurvum sp. TaxID=2025608 RepID=UPI002605D9E8|nr:response regulator [Sulfuricurvum sp.]MDD2781742.1 response regulator [Sulfuricurvum sp.]
MSQSLSIPIQIQCMDEIFDTTKLAYEIFGDFISKCNGTRPDISRTNEIFRIIHTLKALTKWLNMENPTRFFSYIEDVLFMVREDKIEPCENLKQWFITANKDFTLFYEMIKAEAGIEDLMKFSFTLDRYSKANMADNTKCLNNMRVLYVEDDPAIQAPLAKFLSRRVKELILASDGLEGLDKFQQYLPDVIITDINMPRMHGFKMAGEIRKIAPNIPIIVTSAHNEKPFQYQANLFEINGYLVKPFDFEDLEMELVYSYL